MAQVKAPPREYKTPCDAPPARCPECGGLECLCRPRFFAGQLLTDEDLNLLDHYIVAKNKLHNRYLFGYGVVCGLEVVCSPCNMVAVRPGYALSPCGEDITVCNEQVVDVCSLIAACRKPKRDDCTPIDAPRPDNCEDVVEKWALAIRYEEKPSRGITSLRGGGGAACCSKCACGGSGSCGCSPTANGCTCGQKSSGCNGNGSSGGCTCGCGTPKKKKTPAQCEPTVTCEGFRFEACLLPPASLRGAAMPEVGALTQALQCCLQLYQKNLPAPPQNPTLTTLKTWCCNLRDALVELFASHPGHNCQVIDALAQLCPDPVPGESPAQYQSEILQSVAKLLFEFLRDCYCSALLPPCPKPVDDDRIYLATITVRRRDCKILEICNWDQRRFAITFPMLRYWLSPFPWGRNLKRRVAKICCSPIPAPRPVSGLNPAVALKMNTAKYPQTDELQSATLTRILAEAFLHADREVDAGTLALASFGAVGDDGQPLLSDDEISMPAETVLLHQMVRPFVGVTGLGAVISDILQSQTSETGNVDDLRSEIASMRTKIDQQQAQIDDLHQKLSNQ